MAADVSFDKDDVEAESEGRPWTRRDDFKEELDVDDMADTAAVYGQAAGEAGSAGELAEHATRTGQEAGEINGEELIQDDRIDITAAGLQGNGAGMDDVVGTLVHAMNRALEAADEVDAMITGGQGTLGLDPILAMNVARASLSLENADEFYAAQDATNGTLPAGHLLGPEAPIWVFDNVEYAGVLAGSAWAAPDTLAPAIREYYLQLTAETASAVYQDMKDAIEEYRRDLAEYGAELEAAGYDTSQGPLGLWHTDEMAIFYGEELNRVLSEENPDPDEVARYAAPLGSVVDDVYDEHGNVREDADPANIAFLDRYLSQLEPSSLAALGAMSTEDGGPGAGAGYLQNGSPGDAIAAAQQAVANGIQILSDPAVGGYDDADLLPQNIQHFLDVDPGDWSEQGDFDEFNGFSMLMGAATVPGGEQFTHGMIDAASQVQAKVTALNTPETNASGYPAYQPGAGIEYHPAGLLNAAALNDTAAASYLADPDNVTSVIRQWSGTDGQAAAENLITAATLPANGESFGDGEEDKLQAGYNVLQYAGERDQTVGPSEHERVNLLFGLDGAIGETAGHPEYLRMLADAETEGGSHFDGDSFQLSEHDRHGLFRFLASAEQEVVVDFKSDLLEYTGNTAHNAFSGDAGAVEAELEALGSLNGAFTNAELDLLHASDQKQDEMAQLFYDTWQFAAGEALGKLPGPAGGLATTALGAAVPPPEASADPNDQVRRYDELVNGGSMERHIIYDAARAAGYADLADDPELAARAEVIPQFGGDWGELNDDDWAVIDRPESQDQSRAVINASGGYMDYYEQGRQGQLDRDTGWYDVGEEKRQEILDQYHGQAETDDD